MHHDEQPLRSRGGVGPAALVQLAAVARRHYLEGASKSAIAAELGVSRFKVARLIEQARVMGLVRIDLDVAGEIDLDLSDRLSTAFGLRHSLVVDAVDGDGDARLRDGLGRAAADLLTEILGPDDVLGLAWARSLMAMRHALEGLTPCPVVQLTGSLPRADVDGSSVELVRDIARRSGGPAHFFYAPLVAPDAATARALRRQTEISRAVARYPDVTVAVVGVGAWKRGLSTVADAVTDDELRELEAAGVRGEIGGIPFGPDGHPLDHPFAKRLVGIDGPVLERVPDVVGIVYGPAKADAVAAALRGGLVTSLVTHPAMAHALLDLA